MPPVSNLEAIAVPEIVQQNQMEEQKESNNRLIIIDADSNLNEPHETEQHVLRYANYRDRAHEM